MRLADWRVSLRYAVAASMAVAICFAPAASARAEQQPPPIHGVTGTVATEESAKDTKEAGRGIFSRVAKLFGLSGKGPTAAEDAAADEIMAGLKAGTRVMVGNPTVDGTPAVPRTEAVIMDVNPGERTISIRLEDGTRQTLRLSDVSSRPDDRGVVVFVKNESGEPTPHFFKRLN
jgi:hypothetical protein